MTTMTTMTTMIVRRHYLQARMDSHSSMVYELDQTILYRNSRQALLCLQKPFIFSLGSSSRTFKKTSFAQVVSIAPKPFGVRIKSNEHGDTCHRTMRLQQRSSTYE